MSASPYFVVKQTYAGVTKTKSSMSLLPTAEQQQATMDAMEQGLPARKIYPEPAARSTYDAEGRMAGYIYADEEVSQSAAQVENWSMTIEDQRALGLAYQATFAAICSAEQARMEAQ